MPKTAKERIKDKVFPTSEPVVHYLSAQEYAKLSSEDKKALREVVEEEGHDPDEYETKMKAMFPPVFHPKPLTWRTR